jgi:hypothetical protein
MNSAAGRVPSGVERALSVNLIARIGLPSVVVPIVSSLAVSGFAAATRARLVGDAAGLRVRAEVQVVRVRAVARGRRLRGGDHLERLRQLVEGGHVHRLQGDALVLQLGGLLVVQIELDGLAGVLCRVEVDLEHVGADRRERAEIVTRNRRFVRLQRLAGCRRRDTRSERAYGRDPCEHCWSAQTHTATLR